MAQTIPMAARGRPPAPRRQSASDVPESAYWKAAPWAAIAMIAVVAVRLHEVLPLVGKLKPALLAGFGGFGLLIMRSRPAAIRALATYPGWRMAMLYFAWACVTVPFALWVGRAVSSLQVFVPALLLLTGILLCAPNLHNVGRLQAGFVAAAGVFALCLLGMGKAGVDDRLSISGSFDSNDIAAVMALSFPLALGLTLHGNRRQRLLGFVVAPLLILATMATGSRGGTLALMAGAFVFVMGLRGGRKVSMLILLVIGGAIGWIVAPPSFKQRMTAFFEGEKDYNYTHYTGRKAIWARARGYIVQNPVLGVGIGNFPVAEGYHLAALKMRGKWSTTHNAYLQAASEMGLVGGALFIGLLAVPMKRSIRLWRPRGRGRVSRARHRPELLAALTSFATSSIFLSHAYFFAAFALIGLASLADRALRRELAAERGRAPVPAAVRGRGGIAPVPVPRPAALPVARRTR